jgi:sodium/bile acid cotransporter 7
MLQSSMGGLLRFVDSFTISLILTVVLAAVAPCRGGVARAFEMITSAAIALLFFLHGAKLSREAIVAGATHWRLHALVFFGTFVLFPILGLLFKPLASLWLTPELYLGVLFLCVLPSTVQSSIAFTSIAGGNVPAAICSASASNVFAVFLTPLLVSFFIAGRNSGVAMSGSLGNCRPDFGSFVAGHWRDLGSVAGWRAGEADRAVDRARSCWWFTRPLAGPSWRDSGRRFPFRRRAPLPMVCC